MSISSVIASNLATASAASLFTPTQTQNVAFTTPFVQPSDCQEIWQSTTTLSSTVQYLTKVVGDSVSTGVTTTMFANPVVYSNPARPEYSSCQPSGWADRVPSRRHDYEPAVCPSGWWALDISTELKTMIKGIRTVALSPVSTAYCCKSGWGIDRTMTMGDIVGVCTQDYKSFTSSSHSIATATTTAAAGESTVIYRDETMLALHPPWRITWVQKDASTLTPHPPDLTNAMRIPTWTPGMDIEWGVYDYNGLGHGHFTNYGATAFPLATLLLISVCLMAVGSVCFCAFCCLKGWKQRERDTWKEREAWRNAENQGYFSDVEDEPKVNVRRARRGGRRGGEGGGAERVDVDTPPAYTRFAVPTYTDCVEVETVHDDFRGGPGELKD